MYSFKEKKKHLEELSNKDAAEADLLLLKQVQPTFHSIRTFERNPKRYAQDILYALLDYRSRDEIRTHRRESLSKAKQEETPSTVDEFAENKEEVPAGDEVHNPDDVKGELEDVKGQLQEAEERAELAEEEKEDLQQELENEQSAREQAEQALDKEKKKEPKKPAVRKTAQAKPKVPVKSKSTKNTPK